MDTKENSNSVYDVSILHPVIRKEEISFRGGNKIFANFPIFHVKQKIFLQSSLRVLPYYYSPPQKKPVFKLE